MFFSFLQCNQQKRMSCFKCCCWFRFLGLHWRCWSPPLHTALDWRARWESSQGPHLLQPARPPSVRVGEEDDGEADASRGRDMRVRRRVKGCRQLTLSFWKCSRESFQEVKSDYWLCCGEIHFQTVRLAHMFLCDLGTFYILKKKNHLFVIFAFNLRNSKTSSRYFVKSPPLFGIWRNKETKISYLA